MPTEVQDIPQPFPNVVCSIATAIFKGIFYLTNSFFAAVSDITDRSFPHIQLIHNKIIFCNTSKFTHPAVDSYAVTLQSA